MEEKKKKTKVIKKMSLSLKIKQDLNEALRKGDKLKLQVLRMLLSSLNYKQIEKRGELEENDIFTVLRSEEKKRLEAIEAFDGGGFPERADEERKELKIIRQYLPAGLDEAKIKEEVERAILMLGAVGRADFGKVMGVVMGKLKGKADGNKVASIITERLSGK